jgi:hypothetical protein
MTTKWILLPAIAGMLAASAAHAVTFTNISGAVVNFPGGAASFADELVSFAPGIVFNATLGYNQPKPEYLNGLNALGVPDTDLAASISCSTSPSPTNCRFASLGDGGSLVVKFTDNLLTGSGTSAIDLYVFLAGPGDPTYVDISTDGIAWSSVGQFTGNPGIDIDAYGFGPASTFAYVRLRDVPNAGQVTGDSLGADIDAIGAVSTVPVPLPAGGALLAPALAAAGLIARRRPPSGTGASRGARPGPAGCPR